MMLMLLLPLSVLLLWILLKRRNKFAHLGKIYPGPSTLPLIGCVHHFIFRPEKDILNYALTLLEKHGSNVMVHLFHLPYLLIGDPKMIEFILSSSKIIDKSREYKFSRNWVGLGLLTSTGQRWRSHRKILTPSFHFTILEEFVKVFDKQSTTLIEQLRSETGKESFDVFKHVSLCTLDVICESAMGTEINAQEDPDSPFASYVRELCSILYSRCFTPLRFDWIYYFSKTCKKEKEVVKVMRAFGNDIIKTRKKAIQKELEEGYEEDEGFGLKKKFTFLDCLLRSKIDGEPIPDEDIREQVDTFVFEGHDTTSISISFILYCLSKNLDVQERAYQEVMEVYSNDLPGEGLFEKLGKLKYLEQVIKEGLRLYPPVAIMGRSIEEDVVYDGVLLPKGLTVAISPYLVHRLPSLFPDPEKFDPERFATDNQSKRHPYAYIPFSAGPRNCIGQKFAMLELKCIIAKVLRNYAILPATPNHVVEPLIHVTLESANGIRIKLKDRR